MKKKHDVSHAIMTSFSTFFPAAVFRSLSYFHNGRPFSFLSLYDIRILVWSIYQSCFFLHIPLTSISPLFSFKLNNVWYANNLYSFTMNKTKWRRCMRSGLIVVCVCLYFSRKYKLSQNHLKKLFNFKNLTDSKQKLMVKAIFT